MSTTQGQGPLIQPTFGHPGAVTATIQMEVFNIVATYQGLLDVDFAGEPLVMLPPIADVNSLPPGMMWMFHHSQMAIVGLIQRLANPGPGPNCATINNLPLGQFICDLNVVYGNVVFVLHISRSDT